MSDIKKQIKLNKKIIDLLSGLLESGDWNASLFLKVASKQLHNLRDEAKALLEQSVSLDENVVSIQESAPKKPALKEGQIEVFVALYQAQSNDLEKWKETLLTLTTNTVGRPVYRDESHVIKAIQVRGNLPQEGYAVVYVDEEDIFNIPASRQVKDSLGNELLSLQQGAVRPDDIHEFIHPEAQQRYLFSSGRLVLIH